MLKLAAIIDNPGEPPVDTQYREPQVLRKLGYNGIVVYETTGLSGIESPDGLTDQEMRQWVTQSLDHTRRTIEKARAANLDVYIFYDALVLGWNTVEEHGLQVCCTNGTGMLCPAAGEALARSSSALGHLLGQLPPVDGVVLRFGDNDASRLPYLVGNDLYQPNCSRCADLKLEDRIVRFIDAFYELVVNQMDLRLIVRAWNVRPGGMHDLDDLCRSLADRLPGRTDDDRLMLSFKFTETDFWRYQRWNPASLVFGRRPIIYELECQREFEGKGGLPNWQAPLWRNGPPELDDLRGTAGLLEAAKKVNLAGLWAWVRGGGWGGAFVTNENWIDANVYAVPRLADSPDIEPLELARRWARHRLSLRDPEDIAAVVQVLEHSATVVLKSFYIGPFARSRSDPWHPNGDWIQDDLIDANVAWQIVQQLPESSLDEMVREKDQALEQVTTDRTALANRLSQDNRAAIKPLVNTLRYTESLLATLRDLLAGLVAYRRYRKGHSLGIAKTCQKHLLAAQSHWNHHCQHDGSLPGSATAFREAHFWELTQSILDELAQPPCPSEEQRKCQVQVSR